MFRTQDGRTAKLLGTISWDWSIGVVAALTQYAAVAVAAYVLGSIPFAYVWTRVFAHADLRHLGTGNTSIYSSFFNGGYRPAALTLASNCAIGLLTVQIADVVLPGDKAALMTAIFFATAGALWPVFIRFRGGSRGTTTFGWGVFFLDFYAGRSFPIIAGISVLIWAIALLAGRRTFLATSIAYKLFPLVFLAVDRSWEFFIGAAAISVLLQIKHREKYDDSTLYGVGRRIGVNKT